MGIARGPNIIKDGLVFGYDTGYGIANNSTATRFYPGRPTDNLFATTAMELDDDAGTYTNDIESGTDSIGKYFIKDTSAAPWWSGLRIYNNSVRPLTAGVSYVLSFECRSPQSGWSWAGDANASGGGWSGNDAGRLSNTNTVFDSTGGTVYTSAMVDTWQRVTYRVTMKDSSVFTGSSAYPHDSFFTNTNNVKIYYRNPQFEVGKTIATPFVNGARSSTTSLIDLKRTTNIDVSNVSFDSTGQPEFDGTNDVITTSFPATTISAVTIEAVVYRNQGTNRYEAIVQNNLASDDALYVNPSGFLMFWPCGASSLTVPTGQWSHVAVSYNGTTLTYIVNGTTQVVTATCSHITDWDFLRVGGHSTTDGERWIGKIAVAKVYEKSLSAAELIQNYNAYKNRFDI